MNRKLFILISFWVKFSLTMTNELKSNSYLSIDECLVKTSSNELTVICDRTNSNIRDLNNLIGFDINLKYTSILIGYKNLSRLVEPIFENFVINEIYLKSDQISVISNRTFSRIKNLQAIKLRNNHISALCVYSMNYIQTSIMKLILNINLIFRLDETLPKQFFNILELHMDLNQIDYICDSAFDNLKNLRMLSLQSNKLQYVNDRVFSNLSKLILLNLNSNDLKKIEINAFSSLTNLNRISLNQNQLTCIDYPLFGSTNRLSSLEIKFNKLTSLGSGNFLTNLNSLTRLRLGGNYMRTFDFSLVANLSLLGQLDLSSNQMETIQYSSLPQQLTNMNLLDLSIMSLTEFDFTYVFANFKKLQIIYLEFNQISRLSFGHDENENDIQTIFLNNNLLETITPGDFRYMNNLNILRLEYNLLNELQTATFDGLYNLDYLNLGSNLIVTVHLNTFSGCDRLTQLNLANNRIKTLPLGCFNGLYALTELDMSNNKIESINCIMFKGLSSLRKLYLTNNNIISIEPGSFLDLRNLTEVNLGDNYISTIWEGTFVDLHLDYLNLSWNDIESVEENAIQFSSIYKLNLDGNYLEFVSILKNISNFVQQLSLADNEYASFIVEPYLSTNFTSIVGMLNLGRNKIKQFRFESQQFDCLTSLDLSWNLIEYVNIADFKYLVHLSDLDLSNNALKYIEEEFFAWFKFESLNLNNSLYGCIFDFNQLHNSIVIFDVANNRLNELRIDKPFKALQVLRLNSNNLNLNPNLVEFIQNLKHLTELDLSDNNITFDLSILSQMENLEILNLKSTGIGESVNNFEFYFRFLFDLNLSANEIKKITRLFFYHMQGLEKLDLSWNKINWLEQDTFDDIGLLTWLNLEHNELRSLDLKCSDHLFSLYLNFNSISLLQKSTEPPVAYFLEFFDLSHNNLSRINFTTLFSSDDFPLEIIYLNDNLIRLIDHLSLNRFNKLTQVDLSNNLIEHIEDDSFMNLKLLDWLDLSNNLIDLNSNTNLFDSVIRLTHLNLSSNRIELINRDLFSRLFNLHKLDVSRNKLKITEGCSLKNLNQLAYVDLSNNEQLVLENDSLFGMDSIKDIWISFDQLANNKIEILSSLIPIQVRHVGDVFYFKSIYVNYREQTVECQLVLDFIKRNIQLKLRTEQDFLHFLDKCYSFKFFN